MAFRSRILIALALLGVSSSMGRVSADEPAKPTAAAATVSFQGGVVPLLKTYCYDCHSGPKPKGGFDLSTFTDEESVAKGRKAWRQVFDYLDAREMPPEGKPRPSEEEFERISRWIESALSKTDCRGLNDPGRVTMRRLNRAEYNNTIRDLVGIDFHPADDFPSDDVGYGFDNIGDVLSLPPLLLEKYLDAAEAIAEKVIVAGEPSDGPLVQKWEAVHLPDSAGG